MSVLVIWSRDVMSRVFSRPQKKWHPYHVNIMSYKLQNTGYLHCLNNFNICYYWFTQLICAQCVHPAAVQPKRVFRSVRRCTILLESPSVLTTLGSDVRQQSFTKNTFTVIQAVYFCSQFNENNASFAHTRNANRNRHVMHLTRVGNSNTKTVSLFWHTLYSVDIEAYYGMSQKGPLCRRS